ncbi:MAG: hypothetical protein P1U39_02000 [Legionellaceae bacterium]|nr:hypothetical protein [Legionellaceae bacterium]
MNTSSGLKNKKLPALKIPRVMDTEEQGLFDDMESIPVEHTELRPRTQRLPKLQHLSMKASGFFPIIDNQAASDGSTSGSTTPSLSSVAHSPVARAATSLPIPSLNARLPNHLPASTGHLNTLEGTRKLRRQPFDLASPRPNSERFGLLPSMSSGTPTRDTIPTLRVYRSHLSLLRSLTEDSDYDSDSEHNPVMMG